MAPSSPPDDISTSDEDELREHVLDGLRLALDDELAGGSTVNRRDLTKTEEEKLLYFAIRDLNLPLTYSWYLAGVKTDSDAGTSEQTSSPPTPGPNLSIAPSAHNESGDQPDVSSDVERYREYYRDTVFFDDYTERVIESVTYEAAGCEKCVQHQRNPARRSFGRRLLECGGYRDSTAVRTS
ncbi:hypothetical protein DJ69_01300 [Halorubrum persicum]|uniref:DUF8098 domain-containing protein n=1 Tax=Halorubrum persicum TaxID=1383844 RepID=A0A2G1WN96_9EURY|nr:hypothetical protein [Halorubrum persicum]PHQ40443.1 hypothetical protein DJ69_01300 [Halorubrum persicum]